MSKFLKTLDFVKKLEDNELSDVINALQKNYDDFTSEENIEIKKELINGYLVTYAYEIVKSMAINGEEHQLIAKLYSVMIPTSGKEITDTDKISEIKKLISQKVGFSGNIT